jgi:antitoxin PrlF
MFTVTINAKGQITIPVEIRKALKLDAGTQISFEEVQPGIYSFKPVAKLPVTALKGILGKQTITVSIAQMNSVILARGLTALG